ncbi:3beta-hydroxysteroid-dehydrogenase/decarboxylase isoform 2 [Hibiscus syriacus]|uniref:Reticulon-like protein n=1 Tax=Hibiscus syriacus TaxID=106335 RepID=A0A6A3D7D7_HIBSY|nr:3beta-hydroxysteroid-dehydrogenase/decarboxylase-like [Hibiscus syriacus]XP_039057725.1 3beta-hydroxysteroid-dehydrogenase/decarboxylase-like [Hibiscus syriacus]KAE8735281.1 3beta-hydroxysteroid-dehydrogenase/decarboxylase isoform 2 [Hibiscus syriacus]
MTGEERWCVVTGGRGFAARHLVEMLIKCDMFSVRIVDLPSKIDLESHEENGLLGEALRSGRADYVSADLRHKAQVLKALEGMEVVFHMAAPNSSINNFSLHHSVNVLGTKNVIESCIQLKVKRLIYTSSPSVVFDGVHGIFNGNESLPYPANHNDSYSSTKAEGEALVMKSNGIDGLLTCCIRPSSIFGPGDRLLVPSLVAAARAGKSKFIIGDGNNVYDFTYVENVAHAHICAEQALASGGEVAEKAAGQAYFITNMEPIKFWEFVSRILEGLGYQRPKIKIPAIVIMPVAHLVEWTYRLLGPYGMKVPQLTPSRVRLLSCSRSFDCSKAKDRIGYTPIVSLEDGLQKTIESFSHLRAESQPKREGPSKASVYLGRGRVADTLLWKNKRQTLTVLLASVAIYYYFIASGATFITAVSKLLFLSLFFLFIHGSLPNKLLGYTVEKIPASNFHLSEEKSRNIVMLMVSSWNGGVNALKSLCKGKDWTLFLKVVFSLLLLSFLGAVSFRTIFVIGLPLAFIAFYVYEKKEQEIDSFILEAFSKGCKLKSGISRKIVASKKND